MGRIEQNSRKRRRVHYVRQTVLGVVGTAGIISVAMIAPNVFQLLPHIMGKQRYKLTFQTKTAVGRLIVKGHVRFLTKNGKKYIEITDAGRRALALEEARAAKLAGTRRRWDKRYRMVIFDIPERRRGTRERLRRTMRECGFLQIQKSVWLSPYDCEELVALIKAELRIGRDALYVIADSIENDEWIKEHFGLS
jgi:CRISPR/Cas system-associated endoribonuclease Cas2